MRASYDYLRGSVVTYMHAVLQDVQEQERSDGPGDELLHDFVGATVDALHTTVDESTSDRVLGHVAPPTKELCVRGTLQSGTTETERSEMMHQENENRII